MCSIKAAKTSTSGYHTTKLNSRLSFEHEIDFGVGMDMFHAVETSMLAAAPTQV